MSEEKLDLLFGTTAVSRRKRFASFIASTPSKRIFARTLVPPFLSSATGGVVGGLIGSFGGPKGTVVGMGSGIGVGFLAGSTYAGYQTRKEYQSWIRHHRCNEILFEFTSVIASHPSVKEFICPLTKTLMHYPFQDPGGFNYEKKAIEQWVKKHGTSPEMKAPIRLSDLQPNYMLMGKQARFYKNLLEDELSKSQLSNIQRRGIQAVSKDLKVQILHCFEAENRILYHKLINKEISMTTYSHAILLMSEMFEQNQEAKSAIRVCKFPKKV